MDGRLADGEGGYVEGARLRLGTRTYTTPPDGRFSFAAAPGWYDVTATARDWSVSGGQLEVVDAPRVRYELTLPPRRTLTVRVLDASGATVEGATVEGATVEGATVWVPESRAITDLGGRVPSSTLVAEPIRGVTDAQGEARLRLFAGAYATGEGSVIGAGRAFPGFQVPRLTDDETITVTELGADGPPVLTMAPRVATADGWWTTSAVELQLAAHDTDVARLSCTVDGVARAVSGVTRTANWWSGVVRVSGEGRHDVACVARDAAGQEDAVADVVSIDRRGPRRPAVVTDKPPAPGSGGWCHASVRVSLVSDGDPPLADGRAGSGVDLAGERTVFLWRHGFHDITGTLRDHAGNVSPVRRVSIKIDREPPTIELTCPGEVVSGSATMARWVADDVGSGIAGPRSGSARGPQRGGHAAGADIGGDVWRGVRFRT